ncbi:FAD-dependent oxidoreductase [Duganella sp. HH101]|uniref:FAD-dependent oxidoreductase n=1 Tax=Duganella sp. HH101 TaxID=1781066 RepID=UPI000893663A|nr:FAD-dependent oxidoreductase [Duganella sp. HH101]OFA02332.1 3-(3-hydroxy-phenyl)propionate/3-hydroxycinnamic acid hydroxylase [Duganella sp. HH101]
MKSDTDVIVVGAGPVGLLLACELRLVGVDVVLLERRSEPVRDSRALGTGPRHARPHHRDAGPARPGPALP